jgi:predicted TIM-barrel fold metal-dependent hydrolase
LKIISLEDHFSTKKLEDKGPPPTAARANHTAGLNRHIGHDAREELVKLGNSRIAAMDAAGIDYQVISLTAPGCQGVDAAEGIPMAREMNDTLYEAVKAHPDRFGGFAALPTADPAAAAKELERAVTRLGFKGALINGHTLGNFMDDKKYWPIFECAQSLGVPIYLHPRNPHPSVMKAYFEGYEELAGATWGFTADTGAHFLRLVFAGVFDAYPDLKFILGHLGETIPFVMERLNGHSVADAEFRGLKKTPSEYFRQNMMVTTSGNFFAPAFLCAFMALGADNIMFSVDWPFESSLEATDFLRHLPISEQDKEKVAHLNAERTLRL